MFRLVALAITLTSLSGCMVTEEGDAEDTAHAQLQAIWNLDADALLATYADRWYDFGGDRWVEDPGTGIRETMRSEDFREQMSQVGSWQELVVLDEVVSGHPTRIGEQGAFFQSDGFDLQPNDVVWFAPAAAGSPAFDGWGGLYREIAGEWKMVGGD